MKRFFSYILLLLTATIAYYPALAQKQSIKLNYNDISSRLESYKVFSMEVPMDSLGSKVLIDIDQLFEMVFRKYNANPKYFGDYTKLIEQYSNKFRKKKGLEYRRKISQGVMKSSLDSDSISVIGVNNFNIKETIIYFKLNTPQYSGTVYQARSVDRGLNWEDPMIAVKHNKAKLDGWDILEPNKYQKKYGLSMVLTDKNNHIYVSQSFDKGVNWGYPQMIPSPLACREFYSSVFHNSVAMIFKSESTFESLDKNDVVIWYGKLKSIMRDRSIGSLVKLCGSDGKGDMWSLNHYNKNQLYVLRTKHIGNNQFVTCYFIDLRKL